MPVTSLPPDDSLPPDGTVAPGPSLARDGSLTLPPDGRLSLARDGSPSFDGRPGIPDSLGRALRDLRISVTDRCNFRCAYCMPAEVFGRDFAFLPRTEVLDFEEVARLALAVEAEGEALQVAENFRPQCEDHAAADTRL